MAFIEWSDTYSVGIRSIDNEHRRLVGLVNKLHDASLQGQGSATAPVVLNELASYTVSHFAHEERLFDQHGYPDTPNHKRAHSDLVKQVQDLQEKAKAGNFTVGMEVMNFLKNWLVQHIQGTDFKYRDFLISKGVI